MRRSSGCARRSATMPTTRGSSRRCIGAATASSPRSSPKGSRCAICTSCGRLPRQPANDIVNVRLVVLPFANLSNDPTQEYFSDGLTEEMITQIGRLCPGRLGVIARTSSMLFKRSTKSASEIGRELGGRLSARRQRSRRRRSHPHHRAADRNAHRSAPVGRDLRSLGRRNADPADRRGRAHRAIAGDGAGARSGRCARRVRRRAGPKRIRRISRGGITGIAAATRACSPRSRTTSARSSSIRNLRRRYSAMARARIALANHSREPGRVPLEQARDAALRAIEIDPGISDAHLALAESTAHRSSGTGALAEDDVSNGDRAVAELRIGASVLRRSFSRRCRGSPKRKPKPIAPATSIRSASSSTTSAAWVRYAAGEFDDGDRSLPPRARHGCRLCAGATPAGRGAAWAGQAGRGRASS